MTTFALGFSYVVIFNYMENSEQIVQTLFLYPHLKENPYTSQEMCEK